MSGLLGNLRIPHRKNTASMPAVKLNPTGDILLPMSQHIGAPATPVVKAGDSVKVGQKIAEANGPVSSPIYASVSGKVLKIEPYLRPNGQTVDAIRIAPDGEMTPAEEIVPPEIVDMESFLLAIRESGIVGLGGAGFPASVKLAAQKNGKIDTVILNGSECEPYITSDTRAMIDGAEWIYKGVLLLKQHLGIEKYIIGVEDNKPECIRKMKEVFASAEGVEVVTLPSKYPQGAEKVIIYNTTKRVVPEGKLPADVGVLVVNVSSVLTLAQYIETGMPLVSRVVTVDGDAIKNPQNVEVPIGTSAQELIAFCGGFVNEEDVGKVLYGGPMMGACLATLAEPVLKTTGAILAFTKKTSKMQEPTACIHCGRCVSACPLDLDPTTFSAALAYGDKEQRVQILQDAHIGLCMECGCCSYVCPAKRPLVQNNRLGKAEVRDYLAHQATLKK
ncbi:MAG: electron transport complex subunit RsxC [Clostridia bacterium]|nr:electron transport complex subunit RsxC [Clostridia bacterium]